ncbi:MAG TPA: SIMPL domain-containing protein [Ramlibacter sp.]|jgi:predicted secreted protein|uniref:SIMPL domain-containing protein n=1 Tax=Ramlibacter sp. TaxID=1917967 RepID=UPI002D294D62|nr:SIMPL domain-containing protein [Ramlibacter sp.]HZY18173.1 SIMPL domain-containing protein [Ramlibacter sp.]
MTPFSQRIRILPLTVLLASTGAWAQIQPVPENVLQLSASATVEVPQDLLALQLQVTREGTDAAQVQTHLKGVLDAALVEARKVAQPGQLDVRTGNFTVSPRYGRDGRITAWQGTAELLLEGTDFARISQAAGRIPGMAVSQAAFRLSRGQRELAERDAQAQAVASFRAKAGELARGFGFGGYTLREVSVQAADQGMPPRPRMLAMEAKSAAADAAVPVEAGRASVLVNVSGSVQLR